MKKKVIFIPIYRSFGLRYFISSGVIKKLSEKYKVVLFIDFNKKKFFENFFKSYNVIFEDIKIKELKKNDNSPINNFTKLLKKFVCGENKIFKNNSLKVWRIKFKDEINKKKLYFLIYPLSYFLRKFYFLRFMLLYVEKKFQRRLNIQNYFKKYSPDLLIINSYGYDFDQYFVNEANRKNCKSLSIIYSWDNPTSKGYKCSDSDYYFVWNQNMKNELINFHDIKKNKIKICGIAHWDTFFKDLDKKKYFHQKFYEENNLQKNKKIILFFSSSPKDFSNAFNKIDEICKILKNKKDVVLVCRMHPLYLDKVLCKKYLGNTSDFFEQKLVEKYKDIVIFKNPKIVKFGDNTNEVFYPTEDLQELKKLYSSAILFLNEYSTTLLEACIFDLPIINVAIGNYRNTKLKINFYDQHHHLHTINKYNFITECNNYQSLENEIDKILSGVDENKKNRELVINKEIGINPGTASRSIIDQLIKILDNQL